MKQKIFLLIPIYIAFFFLTSSCTTTKEIRRERLVNDLQEKVIQSEKKLEQTNSQSWNLSERFERLQNDMKKLQDRLEETEHENQISKNELEQYKENTENTIQSIIEQNQELNQQIEELRKEQERVAKQEVKKIETAKKEEKTTFTDAIKLYSNKKYPEALIAFQNLYKTFEHKKKLSKLDQREKVKILHNLGLTLYALQKYDDALVTFSKILTADIKNLYTPNAYLYLGKSLMALGRKEEAKAAFLQVMQKYPKTQKAEIAKKAMSEL